MGTKPYNPKYLIVSFGDTRTGNVVYSPDGKSFFADRIRDEMPVKKGRHAATVRQRI